MCEGSGFGRARARHTSFREIEAGVASSSYAGQAERTGGDSRNCPRHAVPAGMPIGSPGVEQARLRFVKARGCHRCRYLISARAQ